MKKGMHRERTQKEAKEIKTKKFGGPLDSGSFNVLTSHYIEFDTGSEYWKQKEGEREREEEKDM